MRAKEYLSIYQNTICYFDEIKRVVGDLYNVRHDKDATENYYEHILTSDIRYTKWEGEYAEWEDLHSKYGALDREPKYIAYEGEIDRDIAFDFRLQLLKIVCRDKSFGHIFHLLASEQNRINKEIIIDCVPNQEEIDLAINEERVIEQHIATLEFQLKEAQQEIVILRNQIQSDTKESSHVNRTMKVTTDVLLEILKQMGVVKNKTTDNTKMANFISYITGYSRNTIRQRLSSTENLTNSHREEVEKANKLLKEINIEVSIKYDK
jgi:hypothetical protein